MEKLTKVETFLIQMMHTPGNPFNLLLCDYSINSSAKTPRVVVQLKILPPKKDYVGPPKSLNTKKNSPP